MTRDEIIKKQRDALKTMKLEREACAKAVETAVAVEREACAKVCEAQDEYGWQQYADAIRARNQA